MKRATFNTCSKADKSINPGDLVIWNGDLFVTLNRTSVGILVRDCNTGAGVELNQNDEISIVKNIQIEK